MVAVSLAGDFRSVPAVLLSRVIILQASLRLTGMIPELRRSGRAFKFLGVFSVLCIAGGTALTGCGGSSDAALATPYHPGSATVVGDKNDVGEPDPSLTDGCHDVGCQATRDKCGPNGAGDVILDASGKVLDVVCYGQDVSVVQVPANQVPNYDTPGNNTVLVIDGANDGLDVTGDVVIDGNNAVIYGAGPDTSVIGGTVAIEKNNAKIRGVRIQGDVTIDKNNTKLLYCVIEGNLTITGNNTTIAECDVYGAVSVSGLNTVLVSDRFAGIDAIPGQNLTCNDDRRFDDANGDHVIAEGELGGPVSCGQ